MKFCTHCGGSNLLVEPLDDINPDMAHYVASDNEGSVEWFATVTHQAQCRDCGLWTFAEITEE